tara:strand:+ start:220 stop:1110 length:891 start_codon:yes stop_codon:yes gene_type:complete
MKPEVITAYKKAGKLAKKARVYGKTLCTEGALILDIAEKIEAKIRSLGGKLAFPVDVSINDIAAHYSPVVGDKTTLKKGDLVKLDLGVHIDGYIADTACSVSVGKNKENEALIAAVEKALDAAIKIVKPGVRLNAIGRAASNSITDPKINIVKNLRGHGLDKYNVHAGITIHNFETEDDTALNDVAVAIEPFTTYGVGWVVDGKGSQQYRVLQPKPLRTGKEILLYAIETYKTLPFSLRDLVKKFGPLKTKLAIREMLARGVIKEYDVLKEKTKQKVAHAEHTVLILDKEVIVTTK